MSLEDHHNFRWQYLEIRTANHHWWAHPPGGAALVAGQAWPTRARIKVNLNRQDYPTLCNTALYHELVHIWGARFHGDSDATHSRTEWWDELVWVRQECGQLYFNTLAAGHVD